MRKDIAIATVLGWDISDLREYRYHYGRTKNPVFAIGDDVYIMATESSDSNPPKDLDLDWVFVKEIDNKKVWTHDKSVKPQKPFIELGTISVKGYWRRKRRTFGGESVTLLVGKIEVANVFYIGSLKSAGDPLKYRCGDSIRNSCQDFESEEQAKEHALLCAKQFVKDLTTNG